MVVASKFLVVRSLLLLVTKMHKLLSTKTTVVYAFLEKETGKYLSVNADKLIRSVHPQRQGRSLHLESIKEMRVAIIDRLQRSVDNCHMSAKIYVKPDAYGDKMRKLADKYSTYIDAIGNATIVAIYETVSVQEVVE